MLYQYEATNKNGKQEVGQHEADNKEAVVQFLQKKNLIPISIEIKDSDSQKFKGLQKNLFERVTTLDQIVIVRNLAASLKAGLNLIEALDILIGDASKEIIARILTEAKVQVENGNSLSTAFSKNNKYFAPFFIGMIKAGELSGKLDVTLGELSKYLNRQYELVKKVRSAMTYPIILLTASSAIIVLLVGFVLPKLQKIFLESNFKLPLPTRILLGLSKIISFSWTLDLFILIGIIALIRFFAKSQKGKEMLARATFHLPLVREVAKKVALVRFSRTMASLISSGVPILDSLELAAVSVGNEYYTDVIRQIREDVINGISLSNAMGRRPKMFPRLLTSLIAVGERTGTLESVLTTFSEFYEEEVDDSLKTLTTYLEPVLLLIMGIIVGGIALSIILPIYQFVGKFT